MSPPRPKSAGRRLRTPLRRRHGVHYSPRAPRTALMLVDRRPRPMAVVVPPFRAQGIPKALSSILLGLYGEVGTVSF
jgi:hypothetical protein